MIKNFAKYLTEKLLTSDYKDAYKKYVIINYFNISLFIGTLGDTDGYNIEINCYYEFDISKIKLSRNNRRVGVNNDNLNIICQSDNLKSCLEKIAEMYDDKFIPLKTYKKYLIGDIQQHNDSRIGLFEVVEDKNSFGKFYRENVKVKLLKVYHYNINKIVRYFNDKTTHKLITFKVEDSNILYQTDDYDDAYKKLESEIIKKDTQKYNL